jgi:hypothetical protein
MSWKLQGEAVAQLAPELVAEIETRLDQAGGQAVVALVLACEDLHRLRACASRGMARGRLPGDVAGPEVQHTPEQQPASRAAD